MANKNHEQYCKRCRTIHALLTDCPKTPSPTSDPREPEARSSHRSSQEQQASSSKYEPQPGHSKDKGKKKSPGASGGRKYTGKVMEPFRDPKDDEDENDRKIAETSF